MRRGILLLVLVAGCSHPAPPVQFPPRAVPPDRGINDGFHGPLPAGLVTELCTWRSPWIRTPHLSAESLLAFLTSIRPCPSLRTLVLVEGPDPALAAHLATVLRLIPDARLEVGNELELAPHHLSVADYAQAVAAMHDAARATGFAGEIIGGAVYAVTGDTKRRVAAMMTACPDCAVGLHVYTLLSDADRQWVASLGRRVWITETGSPTGCGTAKWQEQADYVQALTDALAAIPTVVGIIYYQRPSGPTCDDLATFGFQAFDGTWKPATQVLK